MASNAARNSGSSSSATRRAPQLSDAIEDYSKAIYALAQRGDGVVSTTALAARLDGFTQRDLERAIDAGAVLKATTMRMTLHLMAAEDFPAYAQLCRHARMRTLRNKFPALDEARVERDLREWLREPRTNVEIREIIPPPSVQEAMTRQMSAERTRRAVVTEAEGQKSAAVTVAEGNKEAAILNAEGSKQAAILTAEGERQAAILRSEGFALELQTINAQAATADMKTMSLQYLETLKAIGVSPSSKVVVPMELSGLVAGVVALADQVGQDGSSSSSG